MDVNKLAAARMRARYLIEAVDVYLLDGSDLAIHWAKQALDEAIQLLKEGGYEQEVKISSGFTPVTPDMIEQAKMFPVDKLINFNQYGKSEAWCHPDKNPSLHWNRKQNKAHCFVCGKAFNPIDIVMHQEGLKFYAAVRRLL